MTFRLSYFLLDMHIPTLIPQMQGQKQCIGKTSPELVEEMIANNSAKLERLCVKFNEILAQASLFSFIFVMFYIWGI